MTIVVATDGSDHARKAVELASDIAEKYDAKLVLLNVLIRGRKLHENMRSMLAAAVQSPAANISMSMDMVVLENIDALRQQFHAVGQSILDRGEKIAQEKGVKDIHAEIRDGDPAHQILECAEHADADLIVLGSRGLGDLGGFLSAASPIK